MSSPSETDTHGNGEFDFIRWIREQVKSAPYVVVGPGDDCAVLEPAGDGPLVVTTDMLVDGVHFESGRHSPGQMGRKAMACSLSDIAAMGCRPTAAVVSAAFPRRTGIEAARQMFLGMKELADSFETTIVGGDTTGTRGPLCISVTMFGTAEDSPPVLRSGASPGDAVLLTGRVGGSILGRHLTFEPRVKEGLWLNSRFRPRAMIDVSDGLVADLGHILEESHVGARLQADDIPLSRAARDHAGTSGRAALWHALNDGEDYELLFTVAADQADRLRATWPFPTPLTQIGSITKETGIRLLRPDGAEESVKPEGWEHRFSRGDRASPLRPARRIGREELARQFRALGIDPGDVLWVHSSLSSIGHVEGGPNTVVAALLDALGDQGNLVMPCFYNAFVFRSPDKPAFNRDTSPSQVGAVSEALRKWPGAVRSESPTHSVVALGPLKERITAGHKHVTPYGRSSPFGTLYDMDAKIMFLGCGLGPNSFLHAFEDWKDVPYLQPEDVRATDENGNTIVVHMEKEPMGDRDFYRSNDSKIARRLFAAGLLKEGRVGMAQVFLTSAKAMGDLVMKALDEEPDILLCDRPECEFCSRFRRKREADK